MNRYLIIFAAVILSGCTDAPEAKRTLGAMGFKEVEVTGYNFFSCAKDDGWKTGFSAIAPSGDRVNGTVCSGAFKGATVRVD